MKHIIAVLQPPALKSRAEDALRLEKNHLKDELFGFSAYLAEQAEICESFHPLRSYGVAEKRPWEEDREAEKGKLSTYTFQFGKSGK